MDTILGGHAPGKHGEGYLCGHNMLLAHAAAYHLYNDTYRSKSPNQEGVISWTVGGTYGEPVDSSDQGHVESSDTFVQFSLGWFLHPILSKEGDYPARMRENIDRRSEPGKSRLPTFSQEEIEYIKGTADFVAVQPYTSRMVSGPYKIPNNDLHLIPPTFADMEIIAHTDLVWPNPEPKNGVKFVCFLVS